MKGFAIASVLSSLVAASAIAISGNGTIKEEERTVPDFHSVKTSHGFKAEVTLGPKTSVKVIADENLLPLIVTDVKDGQLTVSVNKDAWPTNSATRVRIVIVTPQLDRVHASGGSSVEAQASRGPTFESHSSGGGAVKVVGIDSDNVAIQASGGTKVTLEGRAKTLKMSMSGGAKVEAEKLKTEDANVQGSGGGGARLTAGSEVVASLAGGTTLHILGSPAKRDVKTSGGAKAIYE